MDKKEEFYQINEEELIKIQQNLKAHYDRIENYFIDKQYLFQNYKQLSVDQMLSNAPKYYPFIKLLEQIYSFVNKDKNWLREFVEKKSITFDWNSYLLWKSGKEYFRRKYDDTQCPAKWLTEIQDTLIEMSKMLQILLYMEFYTTEDDFKLFLKKNPVIDFKMRANYVIKSPPSENIDNFFEVIDYLIKASIDCEINTTYVIDTTTCMNVYRYIDKSDIFTLLKKKEFYIRYRLEYLRLTREHQRLIIPQEEDIIKVGEEFLMAYKGLVFTYNEYKSRLIDKYNRVKSKLKI